MGHVWTGGEKVDKRPLALRCREAVAGDHEEIRREAVERFEDPLLERPDSVKMEIGDMGDPQPSALGGSGHRLRRQVIGRRRGNSEVMVADVELEGGEAEAVDARRQAAPRDECRAAAEEITALETHRRPPWHRRPRGGGPRRETRGSPDRRASRG